MTDREKASEIGVLLRELTLLGESQTKLFEVHSADLTQLRACVKALAGGREQDRLARLKLQGRVLALEESNIKKGEGE